MSFRIHLRVALLAAFALSFSSVSFARQGHFPSTVDGLTIDNAHYVGGGSSVIRGAEPEGDQLSELAEAGVTDVLIFKKDTKGEVRNEIRRLKQLGIRSDRIRHVGFLWRSFPSFRYACEQAVEGLEVLREADFRRGRKAYFHCTYGEDRTGFLAGLYMMLKGRSLEEVFRKEMCENGYEAGNPEKPERVNEIIRREMTDIFLKMAWMIDEGELSLRNLDPSVCSDDPGRDSGFRRDRKYRWDRYTCRESSRYEWD